MQNKMGIVSKTHGTGLICPCTVSAARLAKKGKGI
jgi:hypothetical protein